MINRLLLILVPLLVRYTSGATLADLGLSLVNWRRQLAIGVGAALLMTPAVIAIQIVAVQVWRSHKHPVEEMVLDSFSPGIALLAVVSTMVLAPMIEEILFRGIVQRWLTRFAGPRGSSASLANGQAYTEFAGDDFCGAQVTCELAGPGTSSAIRIALNRQAPSLDRPWRSSLTSLLFASMHAAQWPAPIAIFVLSVALGALYHRTGSLLAVDRHAWRPSMDSVRCSFSSRRWAARSSQIKPLSRPRQWLASFLIS